MLTQAEIDVLLQGAPPVEGAAAEGAPSPGEHSVQQSASAATAARPQINGKPVRPYTFGSPDRLTPEQLHAVEMVHENLAERLAGSMSAYLRAGFRLRVAQLEQGRFEDFLKALPTGVLFHILALAPLPGRVLLVLSPESASMILDRLLGGAGKAEVRQGALTDIGRALLDGAVEYMLNDIKAAWSKLSARLEPHLEDSTVNRQRVQMLMGDNQVLNVTFELALQDTVGVMSIYIPSFLLKPIASQLSPQAWIGSQDGNLPGDAARTEVLARLRRVPVPLRVELGNADLTLAEIMDLRPGDVIRLDTAAHQPLPVYVGGRVRFRARPGALGNRLAVQIESVLDQTQSPELL
jgi:flagellar motor switch protein FliM